MQRSQEANFSGTQALMRTLQQSLAESNAQSDSLRSCLEDKADKEHMRKVGTFTCPKHAASPDSFSVIAWQHLTLLCICLAVMAAFESVALTGAKSPRAVQVMQHLRNTKASVSDLQALKDRLDAKAAITDVNTALSQAHSQHPFCAAFAC